MILTIASGKGGTGKTSVAMNLAKSLDLQVNVFDCDVEEANCHLFLKDKEKVKQEVVSTLIPKVDMSKCDACSKCSDFCEYNAIVCINATPLVFADMCHGCGGCMRICPNGAISEMEKRIGVVETIKSDKITLIQGLLDIGVVMAPPLISSVKAKIKKDEINILDSPPGTSCPVISTVLNSDYVILVTEPTPFGLNDLILAVEMVRVLNLPFGVVVNRYGIGDDRVQEFCKKENIPILLEIPNDRKIAEAYSEGHLFVDKLPEYKQLFKDLYKKIKI